MDQSVGSGHEHAVNSLVKGPLTQGQFDALVDFTYNLGAGTLAHSSLLRMPNAGDYSRVPAELEKWIYAAGEVMPGLVARRKAEAALWVA